MSHNKHVIFDNRKTYQKKDNLLFIKTEIIYFTIFKPFCH